MTEANQSAAAAGRGKGGRGLLLSWKLMVLTAVALAALSGAAVYWYLRARPAPIAVERAPEPPFYLEIKPFVISIVNGAGTPHFVQLGLNLALSGKDAGGAVGTMLPELQDEIRQTVLGFKVEDIVTPDGVEKLRQAMIADINQLLSHRLGAAEVGRLAAGSATGGIVVNIYFSTLIVE